MHRIDGATNVKGNGICIYIYAYTHIYIYIYANIYIYIYIYGILSIDTSSMRSNMI